MKTTIYAFLTIKWLEEDVDGVKSVFMESQNKEMYETMVDTLGGDTVYDQKILEKIYSEIHT